MRCFLDRLQAKAILPVQLVWWSLISVAPLIIQYMVCIWWIRCWCIGVGFDVPGLCCLWPRRFISILQTNVPAVLLDPDFNGMASLHNVDLTTFAWYAVHARSVESQVILHRHNEIGDHLV
jgi:hypothetical protein